jgi:hypothetical protein
LALTSLVAVLAGFPSHPWQQFAHLLTTALLMALLLGLREVFMLWLHQRTMRTLNDRDMAKGIAP